MRRPTVSDQLRLTYAEVLNTALYDTAVEAGLRAAKQHAGVVQRLRTRTVPIASHDARHVATPDIWLTLHIGVHMQVETALAAVGGTSALGTWLTDAASTASPSSDEGRLFSLSLALPPEVVSGAASVGVAALVLRPDHRTAHLMTDGPWPWPEASDAILRALQRIVREHLPQWLPPIIGVPR